MTIHSTVPHPRPSRGFSSLAQRVASRARLLWEDVRALIGRDPSARTLLPFSFLPGQSSALVADAGTEPPLVPGYVFHSDYVPSEGQRVRFRIELAGLQAESGHLDLAIFRLNEAGVMLEPVRKRIRLAKLAAAGGKATIATRTSPGFSYAVMATVRGEVRARADRVNITMLGGESSEALGIRFEAARQDFLRAPGEGVLADVVVDRAATLENPISQMCTAAQMREDFYPQWCERLGMAPSPHRKQWEFIFICRVLEHYGMLREGSRGLGFGVGIEPIPSAFAAAGCTIVATDLPADDDRATAWNATSQLGASLRQIFRPSLCDEKTFYERVSYRPVDMTAIPDDLTGFDFTWSSCAFEHLGSIEAGLAFFERSLACLKPGGIAVHTTELNLSSNDDTLDEGATVLFRRRDFERLAERLIASGHEVMPITFDCGDTDLDRIIDVPPYSNDPHLRLALLRWVSTSFGMIVRKKS